MSGTMLRNVWSLALFGTCFAVDSGMQVSDVPATVPTRGSHSEVTDVQTALQEPQLSSRAEVVVRSNAALPQLDLAVEQFQSSHSAVASMQSDREEPLTTASDKTVMGSKAARPPASAPIPEATRAEALPDGSMAYVGEDSHLESDEDADQSTSDNLVVRRRAAPDDLEEPLATAADNGVLGSIPPTSAPIAEVRISKPHGHVERKARVVITAGAEFLQEGSMTTPGEHDPLRVVINARGEALPEDSMATLGEDSTLESDVGTYQSFSNNVAPPATSQRVLELMLPGLLLLAAVFCLYASVRRNASEATLNVGETRSLEKAHASAAEAAPLAAMSYTSDGSAGQTLATSECGLPQTLPAQETPQSDNGRASGHVDDGAGGGTGGTRQRVKTGTYKRTPLAKSSSADGQQLGGTDPDLMRLLEERRMRSEGGTGSTFVSEDFVSVERRSSEERNALLPRSARSTWSKKTLGPLLPSTAADPTRTWPVGALGAHAVSSQSGCGDDAESATATGRRTTCPAFHRTNEGKIAAEEEEEEQEEEEEEDALPSALHGPDQC